MAKVFIYKAINTFFLPASMNKLFRNFRNYVSGTEPAFALEHRLFNITSFFITSFAIIAAALNAIIGLEAQTIWLSVIGAIISFSLFYVARFRNYFSLLLIFSYVITTVLILGSMYFYNNGMHGTTIYVYIMLLNIFVLIMPPRYQYWVFGILYTCVAALLLMEYYHEDWIIPYHSREEKVLDHASGLFYCMFFTTAIIVASRRSFLNERKKVMQQNEALTLLNEQMDAQRLVLEEAVQLANQRRDNIEVLLNELNHRVKNNLQVVSSLLRLQAQTVTDETARQAILDSKNRLKSMILVHQQLYLDESSQQVFMPEYLKKLSQSVMYTYNGNLEEEIVSFAVSPVWLKVEKAIPIGLISNELITNCFKHAVNKGNGGKVEVMLTKTEDRHMLSVADNGSGFLETNETQSFGLGLVRSLVTQLNGTYQIKFEKGTCWEIYFN